MIYELSISDVASYSSKPCRLHDLKQVNYLFGANGSGKTTISRVIAECSAYSKCEVKWAPPSPLERLVYNCDFRERHFKESGPLKGVFTLGQQSQQLVDEIDATNVQISKKDDEITRYERTLDGDPTEESTGKRGELEALVGEFMETCWLQKQKYDDAFSHAFAGCRGEKRKFLDKVLSEHESNKETLETLDQLRERAKSVFADAPAQESAYLLPNCDNLTAIESDSTLGKVVVGSADVPIGLLVKALQNSDWVNDGRRFIAESATSARFASKRCPNVWRNNSHFCLTTPTRATARRYRVFSSDTRKMARL